MEIILDQIKLVEAELKPIQERFKPTLRVLSGEKRLENIIDVLLEAVGNIVLESSFCSLASDLDYYSKCIGWTFRMFDGEKYVKVNERFIDKGIKELLTNCGISPLMLLRIDRRINEQISIFCMAKRLKPRLTLMCFKNGVVDFAEGIPGNSKYPVLHPFSRDYDVVKQYDFDYDPTAHRRCVLWKDFLGEYHDFKTNENGVLPETFKRQQLQMFLGSCLMDRSQHSFEYFMILQGDGSNGKSVIFRVLRDLFGKDEVSPVDLSQFTKPGDERLRAGASLEGKRLMFCPEENIKSAKTFTFIKQLASGESMAMRKIGGNIGEVECPPILMLNTNHKWTVGDFVSDGDMGDKSMTRRVQIINFSRSIPVEARDTNLSRRLAREKSGIFAWILLGYANLRKNGYRMPENIKDKVDILMEKARRSVKFNGKDVDGAVALYVERKQIYADKESGYHLVQIKSEDLYKNFCDFCANEGLQWVTKQKFGRDLITIGFERWKNEKNCGGDNLIYYNVYEKEKRIADNFMLNVPSILDEAKAEIFQGEAFEGDDEDNGECWVD